jgi:uncharacterized phiE125 gp8 family phage protein
MLAPVRTVAPSGEVVTWEEADQQLRLDASEDDRVFVESLIAAATELLDGRSGTLGKALLTQTWRQDFAKFAGCLRLPLEPVASVASVTYYDGDNVSQTLSADVWRLLVDAGGPYLARKPDQVWPATYAREDAVSVTFVAGYGAAADVPRPIRQAILLYVGAWYENREETVIGVSVSALPRNVGAEALLAPYRDPPIA